MRFALLTVVTLCACSTPDAGRTLTGPAGVKVEVPAGALKADAALGLAIASDGFPSLPVGTGSTVFALTPHGQTFAVPVTVTFPAAAGQTRLLTAQPGGQWAVVEGARRVGDSLVAEVSHFSYFVASTPPPAPRVVFGDGWAVREFDPNDGGVATLVDGVAGQNFITSVGVDDQRRVYWLDNATDALTRLDADGTKRVLYSNPGSSNPEGLAVDSTHQRLYWAESGVLMRSNFDGTSAAQLIAAYDRAFVTSAAVDVVGGFVYWTDNGNDAVYRSPTDGSGLLSLHSAQNATANPRALALDVSAGLMFWGEGTSLLSAPLDGGAATPIATGTITGIAVDTRSRELYWTDNASDALMRAKYDGRAAVKLYTSPGGAGSATNPQGVALR